MTVCAKHQAKASKLAEPFRHSHVMVKHVMPEAIPEEISQPILQLAFPLALANAAFVVLLSSADLSCGHLLWNLGGPGDTNEKSATQSEPFTAGLWHSVNFSDASQHRMTPPCNRSQVVASNLRLAFRKNNGVR